MKKQPILLTFPPKSIIISKENFTCFGKGRDVDMEKKNLDWANIGFNYIETDERYVSNYKDGAWDEGGMTKDPVVAINECAGVLQYAQTVFEGMKAYTTEDGNQNGGGEQGICSSFRIRSHALHPALYVRFQSCDWRKTVG